ncbi:hypothetical protein RF11_13361 [Thelohanellus kitauei]|uniref:Uncharacterized protein n=1 Tax=Thelohanellus kitauei TaxID=669202 RepID=A0A0C2IS23_THEKT|nr:hypothetical protein RF11_13361 [Thelohanellus kitauei]
MIRVMLNVRPETIDQPKDFLTVRTQLISTLYTENQSISQLLNTTNMVEITDDMLIQASYSDVSDRLMVPGMMTQFYGKLLKIGVSIFGIYTSTSRYKSYFSYMLKEICS